MLLRLPYSLLWLLALPFVLLRLVWRARRQPDYLRHVGERLGFFGGHAPPERAIWVHAVSVGETRAAEPLVRALLAHWPGHAIVLTHMTPTGRETARTLFASEARVRSVYLPYDLGFFARRFLRRFRPAFGIIMETELWPNLLAACRRKNVPVVLANARLSERSARRYARLPTLTRLTLGALSASGAQTEADAARLGALGARRVSVTGSIKFDITPPPAQLELGEQFRSASGGRKVLLAASTREGEETLLLDAFTHLAPPDVLLVVVPRHPQRFDEVAALIRAHGLTLQRRSEGMAADARTRVWLGDSMGEMFAWYRAADVALIGGSWLPFGSQNPIEACATGAPALVGPHIFNFQQIVEQAQAAGAVLRAQDAAGAMRLALDLLGDETARARLSAAGKEFAAAHRGATGRTMALVCAVVEKTGAWRAD